MVHSKNAAIAYTTVMSTLYTQRMALGASCPWSLLLLLSSLCDRTRRRRQRKRRIARGRENGQDVVVDDAVGDVEAEYGGRGGKGMVERRAVKGHHGSEEDRRDQRHEAQRNNNKHRPRRTHGRSTKRHRRPREAPNNTIATLLHGRPRPFASSLFVCCDGTSTTRRATTTTTNNEEEERHARWKQQPQPQPPQ
jgi:hypothetical protein